MTEYEKEIKIKLIRDGNSISWLIGKVKEKTGLYFDSSYLCKIFSGKNKNPKVINAINEIMEIDHERT